MLVRDTSRLSPRPGALSALALLLWLSSSCSVFASPPPPPRAQQAPAPIERREPAPGLPPTSSTGETSRLVPLQRRQPARGSRGEHLAEWMNQHRDLSPEQQQQALGHEPGFQSLPVPTQERMRTRLSQLDAMSPQKRQRVLAQTENMERLTPDERAEVRGAMGQLGALPQDQRLAVARTFRVLRDLPPEQRLGALDSGRFGPPLNETQRGVMLDLLRVEPMLLPPLKRQQPLTGTPQQGMPPAMFGPR